MKHTSTSINITEYAQFIWSVADILRGDYKRADYGKVILPFTVLRRLDCVLSPTKESVYKEYEKLKDKNLTDLDAVLNRKAGYKFHNRSKYDFKSLIGEPEQITPNLRNYISGFSQNARDILDHFDFETQIKKLDTANLLFLIVKKFHEFDLHPDKVSNMSMGYIFEELIRKFAEESNETAGEHFTPREVIRLMVNILFNNDNASLSKEGKIPTIYDPACGTGGMLSVAEEYLKELNDSIKPVLFGQEINPESYAICKSDMLIKGQDADHIKFGDTLRSDQLKDEKFDYMLSNPPYGVQWTKAQKEVKTEHEELGYAGRFGPGLPRISDGSLLFLLHMISKMNPKNGGCRLGIVFNGSPLFTGAAGSGESNIRRWIIENDLLETIIALPDQLFYNTGISTYIWILSNRKDKDPKRKGKIQFVNAVSYYEQMSKSLGYKRHEISEEQIKEIVQLYGDFQESENCKIFDNEDFGYAQITIERPKRDEKGEIMYDKHGNPVPDSKLRDKENVPLKEDIHAYFVREVKPHVPDAWIDESKTRIGYEINFTKHFYKFQQLRPLEEITADIMTLEKETEGLLAEILK